MRRVQLRSWWRGFAAGTRAVAAINDDIDAALETLLDGEPPPP